VAGRKTGQTQLKDYRKMKRNKADTNGNQVETIPMFSSVWLALFNELRKNYIERRLVVAANTDCPQV
jgi:hypothetical protein